MVRTRQSLLIIIILCSALLSSGCWNYREIDEISIVAGVAIDKGKTKNYKMTVDIIHVTGGKEAVSTSKIVSVEGDTIFDAARNMISLVGKKLYWSHAKVIIVSKDIAKRGLVKVADWYNRDQETRADVNIMVSGEPTAGEIFEGRGATEDITSFEIYKTLRNERNLSKAPQEEIWELINDLQTKGKTADLPVIKLKKEMDRRAPQIMGTAIFKHDKLLGFLDSEDTKSMLFVQNKIAGGVIPIKAKGKSGKYLVSLEIFKNKTKAKPVVKNGELEININTKTTVAIDEIEGSEDFIEDKGREKLEKQASQHVKERMEAVIKKVQSDYDSDIFGFGALIAREKPTLWNKVGKDWDEYFKELKVSVDVKVHIRNSAMGAKTIEIGD